jgi:hypothetical protein
MTPEQIKALGVTTAGQTKQSAKARILLLGASKIGKTTALAGTAPKPLVFNSDGGSATKPALQIYGDRFLVVPAETKAELRAAMKAAKALVASGDVETIIWDSLTIFAMKILRELEFGAAKLEGFDLWREFRNVLENNVLELFGLDAHVFLTSHITPGEKHEAGELPGVPGSAKTRLPGLVDDWVLFSYEQGRKPQPDWKAKYGDLPSCNGERVFLFGPQKNWDNSGRGGRESLILPPVVPVLLGALGLKV